MVKPESLVSCARLARSSCWRRSLAIDGVDDDGGGVRALDGDGGFHDVWRVRFALLRFCASLMFLRARSSQAA